jgi:hypothetical protein
MSDDLDCPACGKSGVKQLPKLAGCDYYECRNCGPFSISGSDRSAISNGARTWLTPPDASGKIWLRPDRRRN